MKKITFALLSLLVTSSVMAQSAFEGFYGQIGAGYENNRVGSEDFGFTTVTANSPSVNKGTAQANIGVGYNFPLNKSYLLGVGVEYSAINSNNLTTGQVTSTDGCGGDCGGVTKYQVSNRYSIFLTPSYIIEKNSLAYLKVGYSREKLQSTLVETENIDANNNASFGSSTVNGYVIGAGYKQMVSAGLYGFGEFNYYKYSSASLNNTLPNGAAISSNNPSPSAYNFLVGVGYKF